MIKFYWNIETSKGKSHKEKHCTFSRASAWSRSSLNPSLITDLYLNTKSWLFLVMASASCRAFIMSSLPSTTWFTKPHLSACSAVTGIALKDTSRARLGPIMRESFWDKPQEGNIPNLPEPSSKQDIFRENWYYTMVKLIQSKIICNETEKNYWRKMPLQKTQKLHFPY